MAQSQVSIFRCIATALVLLSLIAQANEAYAQAFGVELHNSVMPASGGMGGASIAQPQDLLSAINGNPATISQFRGTQFTFGGAWIGRGSGCNIAPDEWGSPMACNSCE